MTNDNFDNNATAVPEGDMGFMGLTMDIEAARELSTIPGGTEAQLQITDVQPHGEKSYTTVILEVVGEEFVKEIRHGLFFPKPDDSPKKRNNKLAAIKTFQEAFGIPFGSKDRSEWIGKQASWVLNEDTDPKYGTQNSLAFGGAMIAGTSTGSTEESPAL